MRQRLGIFEASLTGSYQRGKNGYTNLFATRNNAGLGGCCDGAVLADVRAAGYSNVLIGLDGLDTRYKALFFTLDKNYTEASGWGMNIAYTLGKAEKNGGDLFSLDQITPDAYGWRPSPGDERHRVVISGIVDLPLNFQFSTLTTLGSGQAYQVTDGTNGASVGFNEFTAAYPEKNCIKGVFAFCEVNVTLAKNFTIFGNEDNLNIAVDVLNLFDNKNFSGFDGFFNNTINPATGQVIDPLLPANAVNAANLLTLPRRIQFRLGYRF